MAGIAAHRNELSAGRAENAPHSAMAAEHDALLVDVIGQLGVGVAAFDDDLRILTRNDEARRLLPGEPLLPACLEGAAFEQPFADWAGVVREVLATGRARRFDALCSLADARRPRYFRLIIAPCRGGAAEKCAPGARPVAGFMMMEDITERTSLEQRLAVSERLAALGQLAARVAHELNNPLDGILRYVNLAIRVSATNSESKMESYLTHARNGLMRMREIVGSLLQYSRSARSGLAETSLAGLIEEAVGTFGPQAAAAGISVVCSFHEPDQAVVRGSSLFQVFCNLVKNAVEAMPGGGTLTIKTRGADAEFLVIFEDTGIGLPAETERIFEPFYTTKPAGQGTGLGLAVCREIVERYGGKIAAGPREGGGAVFTVRLPRLDPMSPTPATDSVAAGSRSTHSARGDGGAKPGGPADHDEGAT